MLDIGCNGGFYSIEMKRRGAERVLGIDFDDDYLRRPASPPRCCGLDIEFRKLSVYDVGALGERFDIVLFMGVLYHLRHPLLALDLIREHVAGDLLVFQSMQRGSERRRAARGGLCVLRRPRSSTQPGYPKLHFIEQRYSRRSDQLVGAQRGLRRGDAAQRRLRDRRPPRGGGLSSAASAPQPGARRSIPRRRNRTGEQA